MNSNLNTLTIKENLLTFKNIIESFFYSPFITSWNVPIHYAKILEDLKLNFEQLKEILLIQDRSIVVLNLKDELQILTALRDKTNVMDILVPLDLEIFYLRQIIYYLETKFGNVVQEIELENLFKVFITHFMEEAGEYTAVKTKILGLNEGETVLDKVYIKFENNDLKVNLIKQHALFFFFFENVKEKGDFTVDEYMELKKKLINNYLELYFIIQKQNSAENLKLVNEYQILIENNLNDDKTPFNQLIGNIEQKFCNELVVFLKKKQKNYDYEQMSFSVAIFVEKMLDIIDF